LNNITENEEKTYLERIYQTPNFKLVEGYAKPNGYVGNGMHSHSNWRGTVFHETLLQDGENAARLLANCRIPKDHPLVARFVAAMRDDDILRDEFSNYPTAVKRYNERYNCMNTGNSLMGLMYFMQGILGYGDDFKNLTDFQDECLRCFQIVLDIESFDDISKEGRARRDYGRYVEQDAYFPGAYNLEFLANTKSWRSSGTLRMMTDALNRLNGGLEPHSPFLINSYGNFIGPLFTICTPLKPFRADDDSFFYRNVFTNITRLGIGRDVEIIAESEANILDAIGADGVLRLVKNSYEYKWNKHFTLESAPKKPKHAVDCEVTFWAVQFLHYLRSV
jgi:hypothetical protein